MSNPLRSRKGRLLPLQEYPGRRTRGGEDPSWGLQGPHLALWLFPTVWGMRNLLCCDCIRRGREMRSPGGTQTSWGKTPTLALLTNPAYVILIHSSAPFTRYASVRIYSGETQSDSDNFPSA